MQVNFAEREITLKLVYYGPALSGKTTNLRALHDRTSSQNRGRLMSLDTKDDRTLFFDMLPFIFVAESRADRPVHVRLKVFTVPGQVIHASTRRLVLQGADGVAFIADSQVAELANNVNAFADLKANLAEQGQPLEQLPLVIQFNKRDLPRVRSDEEIERSARRGREPIFKAVATEGQGVVETFCGLLRMTWDHLESEHQLSRLFGSGVNAFLPAVEQALGSTPDGTSAIGSAELRSGT